MHNRSCDITAIPYKIMKMPQETLPEKHSAHHNTYSRIPFSFARGPRNYFSKIKYPFNPNTTATLLHNYS